MSDPRWNHLPEELKRLGKKAPETPADPAAFKERVLREYERRTRFHLRTRWLRQGVVVAGVCAAVLVGLLVAKPVVVHQDPPSLADQVQTPTGLAKQQVIEQYFNLNLLKRPSEADAYLAKNLRGKTTVFGQNRTQPHLTGYRVKPLAGDRFEVTLNWATYEAEAWTEVLQVRLTQEGGNWVINEMVEKQTQTFVSRDQATVSSEITKAGGKPQVEAKATLPSKNGWGFFAADPSEPGRVAMAQQGDRPQVYVMQAGQGGPRQVATMPEGEIGEMLWGENGLLVVNFSPKANLKAQELWFVDTVKGEVYMDEWLVTQLKEFQVGDAHAVHMLSGNRLRVRSGAKSFLANLSKQGISKEDLNPPQMEEMVYEAFHVPNLPSQELSFLDAVTAQEWLSHANLPSDKRIDPAREVGYYLLNGSVQSITLGEQNDLQVEVSQDPGHLQVLRIPLSRLKQSGMSGKSLTIHIYDESGTPVVPSNQVKVP